ncbi:hypothetical protein IV203_019879 [Nitzschia inconspicua]|uniref:Uncharacterized protein n=1 Tax=Nitzschia inconspicua TaxID=303405 RepID=A0A9K3Q7R8_9STRA|nr:hypothetical protein IV203_019879 [Nitzschia inconspicua]
MMFTGRSCRSILTVRRQQLGSLPTVRSSVLSFSSYKSPPSGEGNEQNQKQKGIGTTNTTSDTSVSAAPKQKSNKKHHLDPQTPVPRFKYSKRKDRNNLINAYQKTPVIQTTQYSFRRRLPRDPFTFPISNTSSSDSLPAPTMLKSINASALLNPRAFCAVSAKSTHTHNVSLSINGTDAARRLLRGKKDCLVAARNMINASSPLMLQGHNVPPELLQHFVNMGDQLLRHYGPDAVECSFHNYHHELSVGNSGDSKNNKVSLPLHVRVRQRNATNACLPPPAAYDSRIYDNREIDWNYHLELYLTVMQNFANSLGKIFDSSTSSAVTDKHKDQKSPSPTPSSSSSSTSSRPPPIDKYDFENDEEEYGFTASPLLFDSPPPRWNVDILKGEYYDLQQVHMTQPQNIDTMVGTVTDLRRRRKGNGCDDEQAGQSPDNNNIMEDNIPSIPPFPIVEFLQESSKASGHVLIRLQGKPSASHYFGTEISNRPQPVTLVFDAGYYRIPSMAFKEH